jgi:hypothetical protein
MSGLSGMHALMLTGSGSRPVLMKALFALSAVCLVSALTTAARAQEVRMDWFPIRPLNFDVALRQQTFAPNDREVTVQAGLTVLHAGNLELRAIYQFFSVHTQDFKTDQHAVFLNPRWNNFIDILDFPKGKPINRVIRHVIFGPLESRAVPYVGVLGGALVPGPAHTGPGHLYGGQLGVRFPVARALALDLSLQYSRYAVSFRGEGHEAQQWVFLTGIRF